MTNNNSNTVYEILLTVYSEFDEFQNPILSSGTNFMLDTYEYDMITFDMSINEIQDISQRNSTYSKTIELPDTDNNRYVFGYLSQLNVDTGFYNPNKRADCQILVDTLPILTGTLQLKSIVMNYISGEIKLECIFFSSVIGFYKSMGEYYLTDLIGASGGSGSYGGTYSIGLNRYNHTYNIQNVSYSWTQSQTFGYYYPLIDYGITYGTQSNTAIASGMSIFNVAGTIASSGNTNSVVLQQMYPAVYVKTVVDEIFAEAGYTYDSNFLNSDFFSGLILPFVNQNIAGATGGIGVPTLYDNGTLANISQSKLFFPSGGMGFYNSIITPSPLGAPYTASNIEYGQYYTPNYEAKAIGHYFENTTTNTLYYKPSIDMDCTGTGSYAGNLVNLFSGAYLVPSGPSGHVKVYQEIYLNWAIIRSGATHSTFVGRAPLVQATFDNSGAIHRTPINPNWSLTLDRFTTNNLTDVTSISTTPLVSGYSTLNPGDITYMYLDLHTPDVVSSPATGSNILNLNIFTVQYNIASFALPGGEISIPANLPANVKQKDFMTNLYQLFNLYVEPDKLFPNLLRIEPRDDYYKYDKETGEAVIKDWTNKIDLNQDITMDILSNTQAKTTVRTYKLDSDYYNKYYNGLTNRTQGDVIREIDNDFTVNTNTITSIFSSSVLVNIPGMIDFPIMNLANQIDPVFNYPVGISSVSIKIAQAAYIPLGIDAWQFATQSGSPGATFTSYPYAGNYDNPFSPSTDLNFDTQLASFYSGGQTTNTLFQTYHQEQFDELNDLSSRILTCEMFLTPQDIYNFYFNHIIYIELGGQGKYWRVNSIKNFDVTGQSTCTVELLTAIKPAVLIPEYGVSTTTTSTTTTTTTQNVGYFQLETGYDLNITNVTGTNLPTFILPVNYPDTSAVIITSPIPAQTINVTLTGTSIDLYRKLNLVVDGVSVYCVGATAGSYNLTLPSTVGVTHSVSIQVNSGSC